MLKKSQLSEMNRAELESQLQDDMDSLQNLRFQKALQQLENPLQLRYLRREIAQIKTVLKEYDTGGRQEKSE